MRAGRTPCHSTGRGTSAQGAAAAVAEGAVAAAVDGAQQVGAVGAAAGDSDGERSPEGDGDGGDGDGDAGVGGALLATTPQPHAPLKHLPEERQLPRRETPFRRRPSLSTTLVHHQRLSPATTPLSNTKNPLTERKKKIPPSTATNEGTIFVAGITTKPNMDLLTQNCSNQNTGREQSVSSVNHFPTHYFGLFIPLSPFPVFFICFCVRK